MAGAHPCYVLVPQYSGVAVNDAYEHTDEVDMVARLVRRVAASNQIDTSRPLHHRRSMGRHDIDVLQLGPTPDAFRSIHICRLSLGQRDIPELVKHKFVFITAGKAGIFGALEAAADNAGGNMNTPEWSARLRRPSRTHSPEPFLPKAHR